MREVTKVKYSPKSLGRVVSFVEKATICKLFSEIRKAGGE